MGKGHILVLVTATVLFLGCSKGYIRSYNRGVDYLSQGDEARAEREFKACLRENPDYPEAHYGLGKCYYVLGKMSEAEDEFRRVLTLAPGNSEARWSLGLILYDRGEKAKALPYLKSSYQLKRDPYCAYDIGVVTRELGRYEEALSYLRIALKDSREQAEIIENLALASEGAGDDDQALGYWGDALGLEEDESRVEEIIAHLAVLKKGSGGDSWDPVIELISPQPGTQIYSEKIKLVGIVFDDVKVTRVYVSGRRIEGKRVKSTPREELPFTPGDHLLFELEVPLEVGRNEIVVEAYDSSGRCGKESVVVERR